MASKFDGIIHQQKIKKDFCRHKQIIILGFKGCFF